MIPQDPVVIRDAKKALDDGQTEWPSEIVAQIIRSASAVLDEWTEIRLASSRHPSLGRMAATDLHRLRAVATLADAVQRAGESNTTRLRFPEHVEADPAPVDGYARLLHLPEPDGAA